MFEQHVRRANRTLVELDCPSLVIAVDETTGELHFASEHMQRLEPENVEILKQHLCETLDRVCQHQSG